MRWLKSTTQQEWTALGKVIPACVTPNNAYLEVSESEFKALSNIKVIDSLIKAGRILVLDTEPAELKNSVSALQGSNAELMARNTEMQEELKRVQMELDIAKKQSGSVDIEAVKAEAQEEIKKQAVAELQEKQDALDAVNAELEKLRKQLAKAKS